MRAIALVFVLAWVQFWDPTTRDCSGGQEPAPVTYQILVFEARIVGSTIDGSGDLVPVYARSEERLETPGTTLSGPDPAPPAPGEVTYVGPPEAIDAARNLQCGGTTP